jgi:hypothetical protein
MTRARNTADTQTASGGPVPPSIAGKNKLINGDFYWNQRNFTTSTVSSAYGHDRWQMETTGGTTYSTQAFTPGTAPVAGYEAKNYARIVTTGQTGVNALADFNQRIEDVRTLAGQTATYSFWAKASSGTPKIGLAFSQEFGTGGSSGSPAAIADKTISTTWTRYSATFNVPSISGKTIGTGSFLLMYLFTSAGTNFSTYSSIGPQDATIDIWGVQLETGSVATPFQTATGTIQGELAACQRYYYRAVAGTGYGILAPVAYANTTTVATGNIQFPVTMRVAPTSLDYSAISFLRYADTAFNMSSVALSANNNAYCTSFTGTVSGATAGTVGRITGANDATAYLGFSAEL